MGKKKNLINTYFLMLRDTIRQIYENVISFHEIRNEKLLVIETNEGYTIIQKTVEPELDCSFRNLYYVTSRVHNKDMLD